MNTPSPAGGAAEPVPAWRVGMVWLVVGGPLVVVVAAIVTAVIAVRGADPVIGSGAEPVRGGQVQSTTPAAQARNHAATAAR